MDRSGALYLATVSVYLLALILLLIAFAGPYWMESELQHSGLWRWCWKQTGKCQDRELTSLEDNFLKATTSLMLLSVICGMGAGPTFVIKPLSAVLQGFSGVFSLIGVTIYAHEMWQQEKQGELSWCCMMASISGLLLLLNGTGLALLCYRKDGFSLKPTLSCKPRHAQTRSFR